LHNHRLIPGALSASKESGNKDRQPPSLVPQHIAFICDGNSRWAEARHLPAAVGHAVGAEKLLNCIETLKKAGVECCTMYAFSTENWKRTDKEIRDILAVIEQTAKSFQYRAIEENVRVKILGDMEDPRLPTTVRDSLLKLQQDTHAAFEKRTDGEEQLTVCLAVNYGGRQDIVNASLKLAKAIAEGRIDASDVTEESFGQLLFTSDIPSPDLVVRTGGDQRLSNFLLWDVAYAELYFSDILWPDFDGLELNKALAWFASRSRRFGGRQSSSKTPLQESHKA
jgi:undecaprenyl diphosphate synthase